MMRSQVCCISLLGSMVMSWTVSCPVNAQHQPSAQTRTKSRSFEGTWVAGPQTVVIRRKGNGFLVKSIYRLPSVANGNKALSGVNTWVNWGVAPQVDNTLTFQFRRALPGVPDGTSTKTTKLTLSTDGQYINAISYHQLFAFGRKEPKTNFVRSRLLRKSSRR